MSEARQSNLLERTVSPHAGRDLNAQVESGAHDAMLDEMLGRLRKSSSDATMITMGAGVVGSLFRETAEAAKPGHWNNFKDNYLSTLKAGSRNVGYGYLTVTAGYIGNGLVDYSIGTLTNHRLTDEQSASMKMLDTLSLTAAGIGSMRFVPLKMMGAAVAAHAAGRAYHVMDLSK
jgi:hypothetical protein